MRRFMKNKDAHQCGADCADACPYGVGGTQGQMLRSLHQQQHAGHQRYYECRVPQDGFSACSCLCFSKAGGECYLKQASYDEYDPVHACKFVKIGGTKIIK